MMHSDTNRNIPGYWAILLFLIPFSSVADSYLCSAEQASGFVFDKEKNRWQSANFSVDDRRYLVTRTKANDIFSKALKSDYRVEEADSAAPLIHCKAVKLADSNEESGLILCRGSFGASFNLDTNSGRYIRTQPTGYVVDATDSAAEQLPYMEIGNCIPR